MKDRLSAKSNFAKSVRTEFDLQDGSIGLKRLEYQCLHYGAIDLLQEAEDFLCANRVTMLISVSDDLDADALPIDFFQRLSIVQKKIAAKGRKRRRTAERNRNIRREWHVLRKSTLYRQLMLKQSTLQNYNEILTYLADRYLLSTKSIEAVIGQDYYKFDPQSGRRDFERVSATTEKRFPKK